MHELKDKYRVLCGGKSDLPPQTMSPGGIPLCSEQGDASRSLPEYIQHAALCQGLYSPQFSPDCGKCRGCAGPALEHGRFLDFRHLGFHGFQNSRTRAVPTHATYSSFMGLLSMNLPKSFLVLLVLPPPPLVAVKP